MSSLSVLLQYVQFKVGVDQESLCYQAVCDIREGDVVRNARSQLDVHCAYVIGIGQGESGIESRCQIWKERHCLLWRPITCHNEIELCLRLGLQLISAVTRLSCRIRNLQERGNWAACAVARCSKYACVTAQTTLSTRLADHEVSCRICTVD